MDRDNPIGDDAGLKAFESFEHERHDLDHNLFFRGKDCKVPKVAKGRKVIRLLQEPRWGMVMACTKC